MTKSILILPVGGSATRMIGLPKFMLPCSETETLIEKHCRGALAAGYDEVHIITRKEYWDLISTYFRKRSIPATIHSLDVDTTTMSETLKHSERFIPNLHSLSITVGLADTAFYGIDYLNIYKCLLDANSEYALALFVQREDQLGKLGQVEIDASGQVLAMRDKDKTCKFPFIWGIAKIPGDYFQSLDVKDAHIGIGIEKLLSQGFYVSGLSTGAEYFDCGTFSEYLKFLNR